MKEYIVYIRIEREGAVSVMADSADKACEQAEAMSIDEIDWEIDPPHEAVEAELEAG